MRVLSVGTFLLFVIVFTSCKTNLKQLQYFQGSLDTAEFKRIQYKESVIQEGDVLNILVYSDNTLASSYYNQPAVTTPPASNTASGTTASTGVPTNGYLVANDGTIRVFQLGQVKVKGLTRKQLADFMAAEFIRLNVLTNPYVEVRHLNYRITLAGDVNRPGTYTFGSDKVNIIDALASAGDLTVYGRRDNILIVREVDGERQFGRIDLTVSNAFASPYYYLRQNDMVVVDVIKAKTNINDQTYRNVTIATSVVSVIAIIIGIFR